MKKSAFLLALFIAFFGILFLSPTKFFAQTKISEKVDYELPYPGLLPNSPLYKLKVLRDRIIWLLISDPLKKAEFDLLLADKRLNGGFYLFQNDKTKIKLVQSTVSKAENYFEEAIAKVKEAEKQGMDTADLLRRLFASSKKHQEILGELSLKTSNVSFKNYFKELWEKANGFEKQVESLRSKN